ncbi:MAG TPA: pyrroline-5-carboxylate reductase [Chitinivibrionales bacterium]
MKVAVLGCGNMGKALIAGLLAKNPDVSVVAFDKNDTALTTLPDEAVVLAPEEWCEKENIPDAVIIAVKPQDIEEAVIPFSAGLESKTFSPLWISIAAGVSIATLEGHISSSSKICRVMPNTPALIGEGISAMAVNRNCTEDDAQLAQELLEACGKVIAVPEKLMNAVTGLSGSGPAYVYLFIESLIEGGIAAGLPYAVAKDLAVQTVVGSALMVGQSTDNTHALKARVMSPGGTTVRGLIALEQNNFKYAVIKAVTDAAARAEELGKK